MDVFAPEKLLIILLIALVLFGGKKLPELARSIGQAKKEFEKGAHGDQAAEAAPATPPIEALPAPQTPAVQAPAPEAAAPAPAPSVQEPTSDNNQTA